MRSITLTACALLLLANGLRAEPTSAEKRDQFFTQLDVLRIDLKLAPEAMQSLRGDARKYVKATLTEGKSPPVAVGVHLRGGAGSFRGVDDRPGLTLSLDKFADDQRFYGMKKFHLLNCAQDASFVQEAICSELFRAAGVPAARVRHALVTLNGKKLGLYAFKEGYDNGFLLKHFGGKDGTIYDGGFVQDIDQPKTVTTGPKDAKSQADLKPLLEAARLPDQTKRFREMGKILDTDQFLTYVALDVILVNWDGYPRHYNNYRVHYDPAKKRVTFIPSGLDQMLGDANATLSPGFEGVVAHAILETPEGRAGYFAKASGLMKNVYKPDQIAKRIDELGAKLRPAVKAEVGDGAERELAASLDRLKASVKQRAEAVERQLKEIAAQEAKRKK